MQGVWIVEIAELDAIGRAEVSRIKAFLTRTTDRFRPPYGRYSIEVPRQCVFRDRQSVAYLRDETGNRRFWPLRYGAESTSPPWRATAINYGPKPCTGSVVVIWWMEKSPVEARAAQDARSRLMPGMLASTAGSPMIRAG